MLQYTSLPAVTTFYHRSVRTLSLIHISPKIPNEPRDASAAACTASALYELSTYVTDKGYKETADRIMESLASPAYRAEVGTNGNFILMHSVGSIPVSYTHLVRCTVRGLRHIICRPDRCYAGK